MADLLKIKITNPTYREKLLRTATGEETVSPETARVLAFNEPLPQRIKAGLLASGCSVEDQPSDTPVTAFYTSEKPAVKPEPEVSAADQLKAMKERATALDLSFSNSIGFDTLAGRVEDAEKEFLTLKNLAVTHGVEFADDVKPVALAEDLKAALQLKAEAAGIELGDDDDIEAILKALSEAA